jgi:APA family basic amino acid/polyamine antiporter
MGFIFNNLFRRKSVSAITDAESHGEGLHRVLTVRDLTFFGIAAIIGAGSFSSIGSACFSGGPAVIFLFIICAIACGFTAMCYADFAHACSCFW